MRAFLITIFIFISSVTFSQQIKATYAMKVTRNVDFSGNPNMPKQVVERIKKRLSEPVNYDLFFDQNQSIYKHKRSLTLLKVAEEVCGLDLEVGHKILSIPI